MSRSRRRRSPLPAKPHHAGVAYRMDATVVALATRWSSCSWRPWVRRSLNANIEEEQVFKTCETWSVMVNLALRWTPRTLSVVTLSAPSMNDCDGGCMDLVLVRVTTSSFVLDGWIFMLLVSEGGPRQNQYPLAQSFILMKTTDNVCNLLPTVVFSLSQSQYYSTKPAVDINR